MTYFSFERFLVGQPLSKMGPFMCAAKDKEGTKV